MLEGSHHIRETGTVPFMSTPELDGRTLEGIDLSQSDRCHALTLDMWRIMDTAGVPARREFYYRDGHLHFNIVHASPDALPSENDVITNLNPWQWTPDLVRTGYLHGPRHEVIQALRVAGVDEKYIALQRAETAILPHCTFLLPSTRHIQEYWASHGLPCPPDIYY